METAVAAAEVTTRGTDDVEQAKPPSLRTQAAVHVCRRLEQNPVPWAELVGDVAAILAGRDGVRLLEALRAHERAYPLLSSLIEANHCATRMVGLRRELSEKTASYRPKAEGWLQGWRERGDIAVTDGVVTLVYDRAS